MAVDFGFAVNIADDGRINDSVPVNRYLLSIMHIQLIDQPFKQIRRNITGCIAQECFFNSRLNEDDNPRTFYFRKASFLFKLIQRFLQHLFFALFPLIFILSKLQLV
ncbi:Uncharacterised protein [Mycobacteroides abscessus subsp. abscessus]|nr:Uncharacterised protein [Mycobacteroides abscessus subsp. abscessus]